MSINIRSNPNRRRWALGAAIGCLMFAAGFLSFAALSPATTPPSSPADGGIGGPFILLDGDGREVTEAIFAGKPRALMFGFTHCPDICPAGLSRMQGWREALAERQNAIRFAFVTVDPERDTPAVLARYVGAFSDSILPLSGKPEQIRDMLKAYGVYAKKNPLEGGGYTMDHHSAIFLFDANGRFVEFVYHDDNRETALAKLKSLADGGAATWRARVWDLISRAYLNLDARAFCA